MKEIYKIYKITNHPNRGENVWEISNYGNVKKNGEKYECWIDNSGYLKFSRYHVHRAVAELFIPNPDNKKEVDHIDTNPKNNHYTNLRWCTRKENQRNPLSRKHQSEAKIGKTHSVETKKKMSEAHKGEKNYRAKAVAKCSLDGEILEIRPYLRAFEKDGFGSSNISSCCLGKRSSHKGFLWKYID